MTVTLEAFADSALFAVTLGGVIWLIISSFCGTATPTTAAESPPEPIKMDNLIIDVENSGRPAAEPLVEATQPSFAPAKPRMYYLDNLKAFLTVVVICHHTINAMQGSVDTGAGFCIMDPQGLAQTPPTLPKSVYSVFAASVLDLNQSYFMALFFFISGFFTPSSLDRKGVAGFLRDRFKRIGIPATVYTFAVGPFQVWLSMALGKNHPPVEYPGVGDLNNTYHYNLYAGQCWYLHWLVLLSVIYAFVHKEPLKMPSPKLSHIFLFAFCVGTWFVVQHYGGGFILMPGGVHSLFYYIFYFSAGIVAKRNDWMTEIMKLQTKGGNAATVFLWGLIAFLALGVSLYHYSTSSFFSKSDVKAAEQSLDLGEFCNGFFAVLISFAELQLFHTFFNKGGRISKFFCESAYGAYIVHFLFVNLGVDIYFRAMKQFSGFPADNFVFWQAGIQATQHVVWTGGNYDTVGEQYTWFGMLFVCAFANLCSWLVAFILRKLPLFNQVL